METTHYDVIIIGAGLSGIGAAYRLQEQAPSKSFAILEARDRVGGTWDLFRYPGVRSDSDMYTLGYPFRPWRDTTTLAPGGAIREYVEETASESGFYEKIQFRSKVLGAAWSSDDARWTVDIEQRDENGNVALTTQTCSFLYSCTGYYDYAEGHHPEFEGIDDFAGQVVHPQFWPEDLDYTGKNVVVIGSGATAVTVVPAMAEDAGHVTMLQRSPTWISAVPSQDKKAILLNKILPQKLADRAIRAKNIAFMITVFQFCRRAPKLARRVFRKLNMSILKDEQLVDDHFTPNYNPWEQRVCAVPSGDLFRTIKRGEAEIVTDHIDRFVPEGIRLKSGRVLPADIVVPATGLKLLPVGGLDLAVDGEKVDIPDSYVFRGVLLSGVPNFAFCVGYTNASWTLRADLSSRYVARILNHLDKIGADFVVPEVEGDVGEELLLNLDSGYIKRSAHLLPKQGSSQPWKVRQNYVLDAADTLRSSLDKGLRYERVRAAAKAG